MFEDAQEIHTITTTGYVLKRVKRLHSIILTPDGTNAALAQFRWTLPDTTYRYVNLACTTTQSTIYTPDLPDAIGGNDITVTLTTSGTCTVQMGIMGVFGTSSLFRNLMCRVTNVKSASSKNLICRVTKTNTSGSKNIIGRVSTKVKSSKSLVCSVTKV